jgi:hypothetical protein
LQLSFAPSNRLVRVLSSVVGSQTAVMFRCQTHGTEGWRVGAKFVRHKLALWKALFFEQLPHEIAGNLGIALPLDEEVQELAYIVHGAPEPIAFPPDHDDHLV